jgi:hypothetical protein
MSLFTYVDGPADLFVMARNLTESRPFAQRLCIQQPQGRAPRLFDITNLRRRIADIQNEAKQSIQDCDCIFGLEDNSIPPPHALK